MTVTFSSKIQVQSFMRSIQKIWWVRGLKMYLTSNIFEVKRKGVSNDVFTSNILFDDISMTRVSLI